MINYRYFSLNITLFCCPSMTLLVLSGQLNCTKSFSSWRKILFPGVQFTLIFASIIITLPFFKGSFFQPTIVISYILQPFTSKLTRPVDHWFCYNLGRAVLWYLFMKYFFDFRKRKLSESSTTTPAVTPSVETEEEKAKRKAEKKAKKKAKKDAEEAANASANSTLNSTMEVDEVII